MKRSCSLTAFLFLAVSTAANAQSAEAPAGAIACAGCHAASSAVNTPVPSLIGLDAATIAAAMQDNRSGKRQGTIMDRIAKGFDEDESKVIADWYARQK